MTREEVIRGLECCTAEDGGEACRVCPCVPKELPCLCKQNEMLRDALALLKEQEPVVPVLQSGGDYVCGSCGMYTVGYMHPLTGESVSTWKYCGHCGKKVRWE